MNLRRLEVKNTRGKWEEIDFCDLKKRDVFRMFEPTGEQVVDEYGVKEFVADSDSYVDKESGSRMIGIKSPI